MGKHVAKSKSQELAVPKAPDTCCRCGWCFKTDNVKRIAYDKDDLNKTRTEPRTQINRGSEVWCDRCYEELLISQGRHTKQGSPAFGLYTSGLRHQLSKP